MYAVITTEGDLRFYEGIPNYKRLKEVVEGYIEAIDIPGLGIMWLNEEGKLDGLSWNQRATWLAFNGPNGPAGLAPNDYIVGNVVLTGPANRAGDTTSLWESAVEWLKAFDAANPKPVR